MKVTWSLASPDDPGFTTRDAQAWKTTSLPEAVAAFLDLTEPATGIEVAQYVATRFFSGSRWAEFIGDQNEETCFVEIHMPVEIKGRFEVDLERKVEARARVKPS